jgi:hypothetical protein
MLNSCWLSARTFDVETSAESLTTYCPCGLDVRSTLEILARDSPSQLAAGSRDDFLNFEGSMALPGLMSTFDVCLVLCSVCHIIDSDYRTMERRHEVFAIIKLPRPHVQFIRNLLLDF